MGCDPISLAVCGVRALQPYRPGKSVEELQREFDLADAVKLASNENPLGPGPAALRAIQVGGAGIGRYPDGNGFRLKRALAARLGVAGDQVTLGNGSNDILEMVARTFVSSRQQVIYSRHAFAIYALVTQAIGAEARVTPAIDWGHDLAAMANSVTDRTALMFIANPNNPTGTWVGHAALRALLDAVPEHVIVVLDEAYCEYVDQPDYPDGIALLNDYPNLVVARTFSKIHGLAGLRIGYAVSHAVLAELLNRVRQPFNVNSVALAAAEAALEDEAHLSASRALNWTGLEQLAEGLAQMGLQTIPSVGNFISVDVGRQGAEVYAALLKKAVIVRPVANYQMPNHLRVTVGTEAENVRFLRAITEVLGWAVGARMANHH